VSGKARRLDRLLAIRRLGEDLDRGTLALALASVAEVEAALERQETTLADARLAARRALTAGDRGEWLMADAQTEVAGWNRGRLDVLLETRAVEVPPAMEKFLESRCEHEQVKQLVENAQQVEEIEEGRRAQAASDDWFLSRRMRRAR
jgi:Leu/Phe-tRNA-protein transferase